jgi:hypothetical protein
VWDYSKYDMLNPVMETRTLSIEKACRNTPGGDTEFYSRFRVFWDAFFSTNPYLQEQPLLRERGLEVITHKPGAEESVCCFEKYIKRKPKALERVHM